MEQNQKAPFFSLRKMVLFYAIYANYGYFLKGNSNKESNIVSGESGLAHKPQSHVETWLCGLSMRPTGRWSWGNATRRGVFAPGLV
ncbi:hypothetical protein QUF56_16360 [Ureibacillus composti]|nr:hypothetical protein [Ureibacillus composti]